MAVAIERRAGRAIISGAQDAYEIVKSYGAQYDGGIIRGSPLKGSTTKYVKYSILIGAPPWEFVSR